MRGASEPRAQSSRAYPGGQTHAYREAGGGAELHRNGARHPLEAVIFLDIDGVLHSLYGQDIFRESCCSLLQQIVRATRSVIVLSSTWRTQARSRTMVDNLLKRLRLPPIVDVTKDLSAMFHRHVPREVEVCEWLDRHPEVMRWIAIDDMDLASEPTEHAMRLRGHFVNTNPHTGLVPPDADLAIRLMQQQEVRKHSPGPRPRQAVPRHTELRARSPKLQEERWHPSRPASQERQPHSPRHSQSHGYHPHLEGGGGFVSGSGRLHSSRHEEPRRQGHGVDQRASKVYTKSSTFPVESYRRDPRLGPADFSAADHSRRSFEAMAFGGSLPGGGGGGVAPGIDAPMYHPGAPRRRGHQPEHFYR